MKTEERSGRTEERESPQWAGLTSDDPPDDVEDGHVERPRHLDGLLLRPPELGHQFLRLPLDDFLHGRLAEAEVPQVA